MALSLFLARLSKQSISSAHAFLNLGLVSTTGAHGSGTGGYSLEPPVGSSFGNCRTGTEPLGCFAVSFGFDSEPTVF